MASYLNQGTTRNMKCFGLSYFDGRSEIISAARFPPPLYRARIPVRGVRTVLRRNRTVPYYTYSTPYCVFSLEMIRFGRRTLNTVRASVYKG